jgi:hypothetical protein
MMRAVVCFVPLAASLRVPVHTSSTGLQARGGPSTTAREQASGPACFLLSESPSDTTGRPFSSVGGAGDWYACTGPADDQELTCFLAPSWMGLADGQWVCSTDHAVGHPEQEDLSADDSY